MEEEAKEDEDHPPDSPDATASTTSRTRTEVDADEWIPRAEDTALEPCSAPRLDVEDGSDNSAEDEAYPGEAVNQPHISDVKSAADDTPSKRPVVIA